MPSNHPRHRAEKDLPLPSLEGFFDSFLDLVEPLGASDKAAVESYVRGVVAALKKPSGRLGPHGCHRALAAYLRQLEGIAKAYRAMCNDVLHTSHMALLWNSMYLGNRDPLLVGWNYCLYYTSPPHAGIQSAVRVSAAALRAAVVGSASLHARGLLGRRDFFTPEGQAKLPRSCRVDLSLCSEQYTRVLRCARIPHHTTDGLCLSDTLDVLLVRHGHLVAYEWKHTGPTAGAASGVAPLAATWIDDVVANAVAIQRILDAVDRLPPEVDNVAVLTNGDRNRWADAYAALWATPRHREPLRRIAHCAFSIAFDDGVGDFAATVTGGAHPENRYTDLCTTFIVDAAGNASANIEHSWGDGHAMLFVSHIIGVWTHAMMCTSPARFAVPNPTPDAEPMTPFAAVSVTPFQVICRAIATSGGELLANDDMPEPVVTAIRAAHEAHRANTSHVDVTSAALTAFGASDIKKKCRCSPDAFVHAAFHLAQSRLFGDQRSTYCALMMKMYHAGRTETLRTVSNGTHALYEAVEAERQRRGSHPGALHFSPAVSSALHECSRQHRQRIQQFRSGKGFHRAAFLLRYLHTEAKQRLALQTPTPTSQALLEAACELDTRFFASAMLRELSSDYLSTSSLGGCGVDYFAFGATHRDGVGIGYSVENKAIHFTASSYRHCARPLSNGEKGATDMYRRFAIAAQQAMVDLYDLTAKEDIEAPPSRLSRQKSKI